MGLRREVGQAVINLHEEAEKFLPTFLAYVHGFSKEDVEPMTKLLEAFGRRAYQAGAEATKQSAITLVEDRRSTYSLLQERSKPGKNDALYRAFAADDIRTLLLALPTEPGE